MMSPKRIHHINFIVRDLDEAVTHYERTLGVDPFVVVDHPLRGATVARTRVGECWLVLVCPYDAESVPGRFLAEHGEGFFLLSFGVDDLDVAIEKARQAGAGFTADEPRAGLEGWRIIDFDPADTLGAILQLTED